MDDAYERFKGLVGEPTPTQTPKEEIVGAYDGPGVVLIGDGNTLVVRHILTGGEFRFNRDRVTVGKVNGGRGLFVFTKKIIDSEQERTSGEHDRCEWVCAHGIGHGDHPHSCDGCCDDPASWSAEDLPPGRTTMPVSDALPALIDDRSQIDAVIELLQNTDLMNPQSVHRLEQYIHRIRVGLLMRERVQSNDIDLSEDDFG